MIVYILYCGVILTLLLTLLRLSTSPQRSRKISIDGRCLDDWRIVVAKSFIQKRVGLLNHQSLATGEGLMFPRCRRVHTVGMLFSIDIVFINRTGHVIDLHPNVLPGRCITGPSGSRDILELAAGSINDLGLTLTNKIRIID